MVVKGVIRSRKWKKGSNTMFKRNRENKTNNGGQRVIRSRKEGQQYNVQKEQGKQDKQ
jgi:hypothetical protein